MHLHTLARTILTLVSLAHVATSTPVAMPAELIDRQASDVLQGVAGNLIEGSIQQGVVSAVAGALAGAGDKRDGHKRDGHKRDDKVEARDGHKREVKERDGHKRDGHKRDDHKRDGHKRDGHKRSDGDDGESDNDGDNDFDNDNDKRQAADILNGVAGNLIDGSIQQGVVGAIAGALDGK